MQYCEIFLPLEKLDEMFSESTGFKICTEMVTKYFYNPVGREKVNGLRVARSFVTGTWDSSHSSRNLSTFVYAFF